MDFVKMQGAGNDYVYVDCTGEDGAELIPNPSLTARMISDRHFGVGSDGLVMILPGDGESDFEMRMFNADGSEAEMCGNASRCVGKYVHDLGLTEKTVIRLKTGAGIKILELTVRDGKTRAVRVDMGQPALSPRDIPTLLECNKTFSAWEGMRCDVIAGQLLLIRKDLFPVTCVSMGNPHCIFFVENAEGWNVEKWGREVENHPMFPQKTNVEFASIEDREHIRMRVWERGSGETMACGTGACATLVAAVLNGRTERKATLILNGGELEIEWDQKTGHVYMTGPAEFAFRGSWPVLFHR